MPPGRVLAGKRVLIVEDRYLIANELADEIARLGAQVVGPCRSVSAGADLLAGTPVDLALLDVNLDDELVYPLAEVLADRGVPFIFLTGYDEVLAAPWRDRPRLAKPVNLRALADELARLV